jgi:DNA-binding NarL/FixJ family response regulator
MTDKRERIERIVWPNADERGFGESACLPPPNGSASLPENDVRPDNLLSEVLSKDGLTTVIIEHRRFVRECLLEFILDVKDKCTVLAFATVTDWLKNTRSSGRSDLLVLLSVNYQSETDISSDISRLEEANPTCRIVLLSDNESLDHILEALSRGVHGYIPTSMSLRVAVEVLRLVRVGGIFLPARSVLSANNLMANPTRRMPSSGDIGLTPRQALVLAALCKGKQNKVIAHELQISDATVKVHVRSIMKKFHAKNRTEIVVHVNNNGRFYRNYCETAPSKK